MNPEPAALAWNYCPICGGKLTARNDGERDRPHCSGCRRFFYSNPVPAACCFVRQAGALLLVQRGVEPCKGQWSLPGGFVELGESTDETALRELAEETCLIGHGGRLIGVSTQQSLFYGAVTVLGYLIESWEGDPKCGSDAAALGFFPKAERPPLVFAAHRALLAIFDSLPETDET